MPYRGATVLRALDSVGRGLAGWSEKGETAPGASFRGGERGRERLRDRERRFLERPCDRERRGGEGVRLCEPASLLGSVCLGLHHPGWSRMALGPITSSILPYGQKESAKSVYCAVE